MDKKIVFMYAGQGSGYYYMGESLYYNNKIFKHWMDLADEVIQDHGFPSLIEALYYQNKKRDAFDKIEISHPAIVVVQYALTKVLEKMDIIPEIVWGNSVGELAASAAAEIISFESMIQAAIDQVIVLKERCKKGNMLAVVGDRLQLQRIEVLKACELAGVNFDGHYLLSGNEDVIAKAYSYAKKNRIISQLIPTNFGFHSSAIDNAKIGIMNKHSCIEYSNSTCQYISSTEEGFIVDAGTGCFWDAIRKPLEFKKTFLNVYDNDQFYIDMSPSGTLATFFTYNINNKEVVNFSRTLQPGSEKLDLIDTLKKKIKSN